MQTARQTRPSVSWVILFLILFLLGWIPSGRCSSTPVAKLNVSAGPEADEELFLLYLQPQFYDALTSAYAVSDAQEREKQLAEIRTKALQFQQYTQSRGIDPRLSRQFADVVLVIDARQELVSKVDREVRAIKRDSLGPQMKEGAKKLGGIAAGFLALNETGVGSDSVQTGAILAAGGVLVDMAWDGYKSFKAADEAKAAVIEARLGEFHRIISEVDSRSKNAVIELVKSRSWTDVEVADEATQKRLERLQLAIKNEDRSEAVKLVRQGVALNPRNFFARRLLESLLDSGTNRPPQEAMESARNLVAACRLVPDAAIYEEYRVSALCDAGIQCLYALDREARAAGKLWKPNDSSAFTVTVLEETVRRASSMKRQVFNWCLAYAYNANRQFSPAEKVIADLRPFEASIVEQVPEWAGSLDYLQACIDSRKGETSTALQFLRKAVEKGISVSKDWWEDPDLEAVRQAHPKEFAELLAVKASWTIEYGLLLDDVVIRNDSGFALSGVQVTVAVISKGKRYDRQLSAETIPPGKIHRWSNVFSVQKDPGIQAGLAFKCDQSGTETVADFAAPR